MAASGAIHGYGATLSYCATQGGAYTAVAEIVDIDEDFSVGEFKKTNLGSPSATHEYGPKFAEPGDCNFKANYINTVYATLTGLLYARTSYYWKVTTPENSVAAFFGFITKCKRTVPDDDGIKIDLTIKRSGPITFTQ
jgi:hypothetical protein